MRCIDEELPFEVPKNWSWCRLSNVSLLISKGTTPKNKEYCKNGINFLRVENINDDGTINHDSIAHIDEKTHTVELKRSILEPNDLLITIAGTLGKVAIVLDRDVPINTNQAISFVRLVDCNQLTTDYLRCTIESPIIHNELLTKTKVTSIPNLTLETIAGCLIPVPPTQEQIRIFNNVSTMFSFISDIEMSLS